MSATEIAGNLEALIAWLCQQAPVLMQSGDNWKITLHGGRGGDIKAEVQRNTEILSPRKMRPIEERQR